MSRCSARGFTLIELMMAIVVLSIGLLALAGALAHALHATTSARATHAMLRQVDGIADSLAQAAAMAAGSRVQDGVRIEWSATACPVALCVRVTATTARDTVSVVAASTAAEQ